MSATLRAICIEDAERALARGDLASAVACRAQLVVLIPEPPAPVLPRMPVDVRRAERIARSFDRAPLALTDWEHAAAVKAEILASRAERAS